MIFLMPLTNLPQSFDISLSGKDYKMVSKWNSADDAGWVLEFTDSNTNEVLATNIPLITGADCLSGLEYLGIGGNLFIYTDGGATTVPTLENLGVESNLYYLTPDV